MTEQKARTQKRAERKAEKAKKERSAFRWNRAGAIAGVAAAVLALAALGFVLWRYRTKEKPEEEQSSRPNIRVELLPLETADPFEAQYEITNASVEALRSPTVSCAHALDRYENGFTVERSYHGGFGDIEDIAPKATITEPCPAVAEAGKLRYAEIQLVIRYDYGTPPERLENRFNFRGELIDGKVRWLKNGATPTGPLQMSPMEQAATAAQRQEATQGEPKPAPTTGPARTSGNPRPSPRPSL